MVATNQITCKLVDNNTGEVSALKRNKREFYRSDMWGCSSEEPAEVITDPQSRVNELLPCIVQQQGGTAVSLVLSHVSETLGI